MKRLRGRTLITLLLALFLAAGVVYFCCLLGAKGQSWVGFFGATDYYASGAIYDSKGVLLYNREDGSYAQDKATRVSTLHLVGDSNFGTSLRAVLSSRLTGYNPITGTTLGAHDITLTVDSSLNKVAYAALNGKKGVVAVYNYQTGDLKCLVSAPSYDPNKPPSNINESSAYEGVYLNRFFSVTYPPGSTFKIVTTAAALENLSNFSTRTYSCTGSTTIEGTEITCPYAHGKNMDIYTAFARSCNGAYAHLALDLGGETLQKYMKQAGLLDSQDISGIHTAAGNFTAEPAGSANLGWSGVGQDKDLVNPCAMLTFAGGIANRGVAVMPRLVDKETLSGTSIPVAFSGGKETSQIYSADTCAKLKDMMRNNVTSEYGQSQFGDLPVCAKSGTAEVGGNLKPHAWFVGFVDDDKNPLAFVVIVENGGYGAKVAGSVAAKVLAAATAG